MKKAEIYFFPNGNTAGFIDNEQLSGLQESWFRLYIRHVIEALDRNKIDIEGSRYHLPDGSIAEVFETKTGFNWRIVDENA